MEHIWTHTDPSHDFWNSFSRSLHVIYQMSCSVHRYIIYLAHVSIHVLRPPAASVDVCVFRRGRTRRLGDLPSHTLLKVWKSRTCSILKLGTHPSVQVLSLIHDRVCSSSFHLLLGHPEASPGLVGDVVPAASSVPRGLLQVGYGWKEAPIEGSW